MRPTYRHADLPGLSEPFAVSAVGGGGVNISEKKRKSHRGC